MTNLYNEEAFENKLLEKMKAAENLQKAFVIKDIDREHKTIRFAFNSDVFHLDVVTFFSNYGNVRRHPVGGHILHVSSTYDLDDVLDIMKVFKNINKIKKKSIEVNLDLRISKVFPNMMVRFWVMRFWDHDLPIPAYRYLGNSKLTSLWTNELGEARMFDYSDVCRYSPIDFMIKRGWVHSSWVSYFDPSWHRVEMNYPSFMKEFVK